MILLKTIIIRAISVIKQTSSKLYFTSELRNTKEMYIISLQSI